MSRLPVVSGDNNAWGSILNDYLSVALGADGTVKRIGVTSAGISRAVNPGGQVNFCQNTLLPPAVTSTLQGIGLAIESTGGENGGGFIPLYIGNQTGASTGNAWGINVTVLQTAGTVVRQIIGTEMNIANNQTDATLGSGSQVGMSVNSGGSKIAALAYNCAGTAQWLDGFFVTQGAIASSGYAFRYVGTTTQTAGLAVTHDARVQLGFISNLGSAHEIHMLNSKNISGLNQPQTVLVPMLAVSTGSDVLIAPAGDNIRWGTPQNALGGGAGATLGTVGGAGPPSAAQKSWEKRISSTGGTFWTPVWSSS